MGVAEGASESTGCGGLEGLQKEEGDMTISECMFQLHTPQTRAAEKPSLYVDKG